MSAGLHIHDLQVEIDGIRILQGLDLHIPPGDVQALMGPNGSGKSSLAFTLAGHPRYRVTGGTVHLDGEDLLTMEPDVRARRGLFLAFQYPSEIPGISLEEFLREAVGARRGESIPPEQFREELFPAMDALHMDHAFASRSLNEGFSGGEKKRCEALQMTLLKPRILVLDETDSGLDIDSLRIVSEGVNRLRGPETGILVITHYTRILRHIPADRVHVLMAGRVVRSGGPELADLLEEKGYDAIRKEEGLETARTGARPGAATKRGAR
jgi:Fe-S cluster assembly ATP-binding protein